jgi:hypothetical protein
MRRHPCFPEVTYRKSTSCFTATSDIVRPNEIQWRLAMNRVLSLPHTPILPGLLARLQEDRIRTDVTDKGMIRFELPLGPVEMRFCDPQQQLPPGTSIYVWWKGGGFVCESVDVVDSEESKARGIAEQVRNARVALSQARTQRRERQLGEVVGAPRRNLHGDR